MFTVFLISNMFFNILSSTLWIQCSISCWNRKSWLARQSCQRCLRILLYSSQMFNFLRYWKSSRRFPFPNDVSRICKSGYLARYSCLQGVTVYTYSPLSYWDNKKHNKKSVLFNRIAIFTIFVSLHKDKIFVRKHQ